MKQAQAEKQESFMDVWATSSFKDWFSGKQPQLSELKSLIPHTSIQALETFYADFLKMISSSPLAPETLSVLATYEQRVKKSSETLFCQIVDYFYANYTPNMEVASTFLNYVTVGISNLMIHSRHPLIKLLDKTDELFEKWWNEELEMDMSIASAYLAEAVAL